MSSLQFLELYEQLQELADEAGVPEYAQAEWIGEVMERRAEGEDN